MAKNNRNGDILDLEQQVADLIEQVDNYKGRIFTLTASNEILEKDKAHYEERCKELSIALRSATDDLNAKTEKYHRYITILATIVLVTVCLSIMLAISAF